METDKIILDKKTMGFCINLVWQYKFLADTGTTKKHKQASENYENVLKTLEHYNNIKNHPVIEVV